MVCISLSHKSRGLIHVVQGSFTENQFQKVKAGGLHYPPRVSVDCILDFRLRIADVLPTKCSWRKPCMRHGAYIL